MKTIIHKITWKAKVSKTKTDVTFEVTEEDCFVRKVTHPLGNWMLNQPWCRCYSWLKRKYADIVSEERILGDEFPRMEINPRRLSDREWLERIRNTKS